MHINVYSIEKSTSKPIKSLIDEYIKMAKKYANLKDICMFNKQISKAQMVGENEAKVSYTKAYEPYLDGQNVCLDVKGDELDSFEFSKLFKNSSKINFFIGGAYGFEKSFLDKAQRVISLSRLTYAHKIAKVVLYEQIYRGLAIANNHPYHK